MEICDAEILDELTTRRGELKLITVSFKEDKHGQVSNTISIINMQGRIQDFNFWGAK